MEIELTQASWAALKPILHGRMTPHMAAEYLREQKIYVRSFAETLREMYPGKDLEAKLLALFMLTEESPNRRSLTKKIQNWLSGRTLPAVRHDYFRIAFALHLSEAQLDRLLSIATGYGIQYRSSEEAVLTWFLRGGYGYLEAVEFYSSLPALDETEQLPEGATSQITHELQNEFLSAVSTEDLWNTCLRNSGRYGRLHLRSWYYFERFLNQLIHPSSPYGDDEAEYSIDTVMNVYLSLRMPSGRKRQNYSLVQKLIKQNWPNTTGIKNILNHTEDVPRKLLLILYVVTENGASDDYLESDEDYTDIEDRVQDHWWVINAMLADCGMASLDLRNAFDWLILYSIACDPDEAMSERLEHVIDDLFGDVRAEQPALS